jgi:hypothetical protein
MVVAGETPATSHRQAAAQGQEKIMHIGNMTNEQHEAKFLREGIASRLRQLRDIADRIEEGAYQALERAEQGKGTYSSVSEVFTKQISWGVANLSVEGLTYTAACADVYRAEEKAENKNGSQL